MTNAYREIIQRLMQIEKPTSRDVNLAKTQVAQARNLQTLPPNSMLIRNLKPNEKRLMPILRRKHIRTISGVIIVAVMTKPYPCPKTAPCAYCPGGPSVGSPQSYTGFEPAAMRGIQNRYSPYRQVRSRINQLESIGHKVDKVELVIMGGTFPATPMKYQSRFVQRCLDAMTRQKSKSLTEAKKHAETSHLRNVGITVETRPDWAKRSQIDHMLTMGVTRVELGVQNIYNDIYQRVNREHTVQDVIEATHVLKDAGLKVAYHMMPGLPGSNQKRDLNAFKTIFTDSAFKPDMIKVYPCLVLKGTKTYEWWKKGTYTPYTTEQAAELIAEIKKTVPPWVRIMRVQRDIPAQLIEAGVKHSNLRQLAQQKLSEKNLRCRCIRCREVGHKWLKDHIQPDLNEVKIQTTTYQASGGTEICISAEDTANDILIGYLRLRIPSTQAYRPEINAQLCSIVRELRVYGPVVPVGKHQAKAWQHKGIGQQLLTKAEHITHEEFKRDKIVVTSALGTKQYYKRFGYHHDGPYMSKTQLTHG
jgi:elongator complex protein 3